MKRFVWRLQKVLDIKGKQEQLKRTELFSLAERLAERRSTLLLRQRVLRDIMAGITRDASPRRLAAQEFFFKHAGTDEQRIQQLKRDIAELETRRKEATAEMLALRRSREALERLRAEAEERFLREQEKLEQKESDDRTTIAFARRELGRGQRTSQDERGGATPFGRECYP